MVNAEETQQQDEAVLSQFSGNSLTVLQRRYLRKGPDGEPNETVSEMFHRVAHHIALPEEQWGKGLDEAETLFYSFLTQMRFVPNSPTFTGAGTPLGQLAACFVLPIEDDMGRSEGGIFQTLRDAALIQQTGGGNGFSFSRLRPKQSLVISSMGRATGPVGFLRVYDKAFGEIAQGGTRRGANMAVLRVDHPDIEDFISCKTSEDAITNFNISIGMLDDFLTAVEDDSDWELKFPDVQHPNYREFHGTLEQAEEQGIALQSYKTVKARALFEQIVNQAWSNGEPGLLFLDAAQRDNPLPALGRYECTNPCGEQFLMPYENCCLASINLAKHLDFDDAGQPIIDWEKLAETCAVATRFLDDVVDANAYVPAVPQLEQAAHRARRIGLGIMGLADVLYHLGIAYGSDAGQQVAAQLMEYIRFYAMRASVDLAKTRKPFPVIDQSIYAPDTLWRPRSWPEWLNGAPSPQWNRPSLDWDSLVADIAHYGIRNSTQLTIAPTGTIATVAGTEGYGCEPVFALAYTRYVREADEQISLHYVSPRFQQALDNADLSTEEQTRILDQVSVNGSCQNVDLLPDAIKNVYVVSGDISAEGHIRMQAALQLFTDASISKTINFPPATTTDEIADAFLLAWKLGCKGLTVYVSGSREQEVLETQATRNKKEGTAREESAALRPVPTGIKTVEWVDSVTVKPRPTTLVGMTYQAQTPLGTAYVTVNTNGYEQPFEVFLNVGKAGSDTAAVAEAIGRLISLVLRLSSPLEPRIRMEQIVNQLSGIGGRRPFGFGHNRVLSLPDGVATVLKNYLEATAEDPSITNIPHDETIEQPKLALFQVGDLCPECGQAALVNTEG
ncbi:MAG: adenosylcobalamin-dependent ribonucleoside-diphosphate reductase, partial [Anaerolineae bacterium]|nr:adenosylcobalamin-dependent ribonucleoside-diphosphate reductase [Anaerolineae bacterium]